MADTPPKTCISLTWPIVTGEEATRMEELQSGFVYRKASSDSPADGREIARDVSSSKKNIQVDCQLHATFYQDPS
jgi:hypothetical protein